MATVKKERAQAHGLTPEQMADLQQQQIAEEAVPHVRVKGGDYAFPKHEKHLVHARIQQGGFDSQTGEALAKPVVQKFETKEFARMKDEQAFAGMKVEILHDGNSDAEVEDVDPTDYLKPMVVSQPGAGTPLTDTFADYEKKSEKELREIMAKHFPERKGEFETMKKKDMLPELKDRLSFLADEERAEELKRQEEARIAAAGGGEGTK